LTLQDFIKKIPSHLLKSAKAFQGKVRELEETEKGKFQAFVDDDFNSFDVCISFDKEAMVLSHSCDCDSKTKLCAHQTTVLLQLNSGEGNKDNSILIKKIRKKKITFEEELLDSLSSEQIKVWVSDLIKSDKEFSLKFLSKFAPKQEILTSHLIVENYSSALKAVAGKKKYIDASQIQRTLDLLAPFHHLVINDFYENKLKELDFGLLLEVHNVINKLYYSIKNSTTKIKSYREKFWGSVFEKLNFHDTKQIGDILDLMVYTFNDKYIAIIFLKLHPEILSIPKFKNLIKDAIPKILGTNLSEEKYVEFLNVFINAQAFESFADQFKIVKFANKYNLPLISQLIVLEKYNRAKVFISEAMTYNTKAKYSVPYIELRRKIAAIEYKTEISLN
jgi:hypothetical protein